MIDSGVAESNCPVYPVWCPRPDGLTADVGERNVEEFATMRGSVGFTRQT